MSWVLPQGLPPHTTLISILPLDPVADPSLAVGCLIRLVTRMEGVFGSTSNLQKQGDRCAP